MALFILVAPFNLFSSTALLLYSLAGLAPTPVFDPKTKGDQGIMIPLENFSLSPSRF